MATDVCKPSEGDYLTKPVSSTIGKGCESITIFSAIKPYAEGAIIPRVL